MRTKQFFIALIFSVILFACTIDDRSLSDENIEQTLEDSNVSQLSRIEEQEFHIQENYHLSRSNEVLINSDNNVNCVYDSYTIYHPCPPLRYLSNYKYAKRYRASMIKKTLSNGCSLYIFPNKPNFKYVNGLFTEEIKKIYEEIFEPGSVTDDIEL